MDKNEFTTIMSNLQKSVTDLNEKVSAMESGGGKSKKGELEEIKNMLAEQKTNNSKKSAYDSVEKLVNSNPAKYKRLHYFMTNESPNKEAILQNIYNMIENEKDKGKAVTNGTMEAILKFQEDSYTALHKDFSSMSDNFKSNSLYQDSEIPKDDDAVSKLLNPKDWNTPIEKEKVPISINRDPSGSAAQNRPKPSETSKEDKFELALQKSGLSSF